jgi:hypothetical protein
MLLLSSMRKMVSNCVRKTYGKSDVVCIGLGTRVEFTAGLYAGGGLVSVIFEPGRRVGGEGLEKRLVDCDKDPNREDEIFPTFVLGVRCCSDDLDLKILGSILGTGESDGQELAAWRRIGSTVHFYNVE